MVVNANTGLKHFWDHTETFQLVLTVSRGKSQNYSQQQIGMIGKNILVFSGMILNTQGHEEQRGFHE